MAVPSVRNGSYVVSRSPKEQLSTSQCWVWCNPSWVSSVKKEALDCVYERLAWFDDGTLWAEALFVTDETVEVLDEADERAFSQETASSATRSSARKYFQDDYEKKATRHHSDMVKHTEQETQKAEDTLLP